MYAVIQINITGGYADASGHGSAVSALAPYGLLVTVRRTSHHRNAPRAALCVYLGQCTHGGPSAYYVAPLPAPGTILGDLRYVRISASVVFVAAPGERVADATIASNMHHAAGLAVPVYTYPLIAAVGAVPDPPFNACDAGRCCRLLRRPPRPCRRIIRRCRRPGGPGALGDRRCRLQQHRP